MNILILSAGTRNKIVQYFKKELDGCGKVVATDMSALAPALYEADKFYIVPRMTEEGYIEKILNICQREKINGVFSLIDPELSLLAQNCSRFEKIGVKVIGSSFDLCELSLNKYDMFRWLSSRNYKCAKSYTKIEDFYADLGKGLISFPVFVKPVRGSASISISKVNDKEALELLFKQFDDLMIQEYLQGQEIGADVYIDMVSGKVVSIFTKKKLKMRAGETDKAVSFKNEKLFSLIKRFAEEIGYKAQIDIDIFDIGGEYYISEVNPRFGGGYPHAFECGCDHVKMIIRNLNGGPNNSHIGEYEEGLYMMKYNELLVKKL